MRLLIAAIGKMRGRAEASLVEDYLDRARGFGRRIGFSDVALQEFEAPRALSGPALKKREAELLLAAAPEGGRAFVLDERGENISSENLAALLGRLRDDGAPAAAFFIGGADGHDKALRDKADHLISFGKATWPHMLVRAMLAEQLYRSMTILSGHPYHRS
ncbi:23S rRNA (pseudouridine(1915)-N(3))-methyltransferase RlmH [Hyphococcus sp.]|uniref:23S rRNA (pseudouridine(1915)-N(3))-methyltransferase RlmH n=1 Tax=Hyphococcus sp. TaxID=2038636 RepID=UPI0035C77EC7